MQHSTDKPELATRVGVDNEGKHPIVSVDVPSLEPPGRALELGETVARWRSRLQDMMITDDAAELIARAADTTMGVIGGPGENIGGRPGGTAPSSGWDCIFVCLFCCC